MQISQQILVNSSFALKTGHSVVPKPAFPQHFHVFRIGEAMLLLTVIHMYVLKKICLYIYMYIYISSEKERLR